MMAGPGVELPLQLSVIDRLLDDDAPAMRSRGQNLAALRRSVGRDIEALLNTRQRCVSPPAGLHELDVSLVNYGIPDFTGINLASEDAREGFRRAVEDVLRRFEPRFRRVAVELLDNADSLDRTLRFRIDALIEASPEPEPLVLHSELEPVSHTFHVRTAKDV